MTPHPRLDCNHYPNCSPTPQSPPWLIDVDYLYSTFGSSLGWLTLKQFPGLRNSFILGACCPQSGLPQSSVCEMVKVGSRKQEHCSNGELHLATYRPGQCMLRPCQRAILATPNDCAMHRLIITEPMKRESLLDLMLSGAWPWCVHQE